MTKGNIMRDFVTFAAQEIHPVAASIILDAEDLRARGVVGDGELTRVARVYAKEVGLPVASAMLSVANEAYRIIALRSIGRA
jgi:hypothetical protein